MGGVPPPCMVVEVVLDLAARLRVIDELRHRFSERPLVRKCFVFPTKSVENVVRLLRRAFMPQLSSRLVRLRAYLRQLDMSFLRRFPRPQPAHGVQGPGSFGGLVEVPRLLLLASPAPVSLSVAPSLEVQGPYWRSRAPGAEVWLLPSLNFAPLYQCYCAIPTAI